MSVTAARIQRVHPETRKREVIVEFKSTLHDPRLATNRVMNDVFDYLKLHPNLDYSEIWMHYRKTPQRE